MANHEELKKIAIKCIEDDNFRAALEADPAKAAASIGIELTAEQAATVKKTAAQAVSSRESKSIVKSIVDPI